MQDASSLWQYYWWKSFGNLIFHINLFCWFEFTDINYWKTSSCSGGLWKYVEVDRVLYYWDRCLYYAVRRIPGTILVTLVMFGLGSASALDFNVLVNQDTVWAYALLLSGCFMVFIVIRYGPLKLRRKIYTEFGIGDWPLPIIWVFIIVYVGCPECSFHHRDHAW